MPFPRHTADEAAAIVEAAGFQSATADAAERCTDCRRMTRQHIVGGPFYCPAHPRPALQVARFYRDRDAAAPAAAVEAFHETAAAVVEAGGPVGLLAKLAQRRAELADVEPAAPTVPAGYERHEITAAALRPGDVVVDPADGSRDWAAFDVDTAHDSGAGFPVVKVWTGQADQDNGRPPVLLLATNVPLTVYRRPGGPVVTVVEAGNMDDADDAATMETADTQPATGARVLLDDIRDAMPAGWHVDPIGSGVVALVDYAGTTVTINHGQRSGFGPVAVEVCRDGRQIIETTAADASGAAGIVAAVVELGARADRDHADLVEQVRQQAARGCCAPCQDGEHADDGTGTPCQCCGAPAAAPSPLLTPPRVELVDPEPAETYGIPNEVDPFGPVALRTRSVRTNPAALRVQLDAVGLQAATIERGRYPGTLTVRIPGGRFEPGQRLDAWDWFRDDAGTYHARHLVDELADHIAEGSDPGATVSLLAHVDETDAAPWGRCDSCGAVCDAAGCTTDPAHLAAIDATA